MQAPRLMISRALALALGVGLVALACSRTEEGPRAPRPGDPTYDVHDGGLQRTLDRTGDRVETGTGNLGTPAQYGPGLAPSERDAGVDPGPGRGHVP